MTARRIPEFDDGVNGAFPPLRVPVLDRDIQSADLLANLDPDLYNQRLDVWVESNLAAALGRDELPDTYFDTNKTRFAMLSKLVARRRVVPFVGAGASASCGVPTWTAYLFRLAVEADYPSDELRSFLDDGRYEDAASALLQHVGDPAFRESFDRVFSNLAPPGPASLPSIITSTFDGPIITTNYDQLIERTVAFQTFLGSSPGDFRSAARDGSRALLKIHGDLYQPRARVLTRTEYNRAYGRGEEPDWTRPLPQVLRWVFLRDTVCFLGASLSNDRTMRLLQALSQDRVEGHSMRHFAIVELPANRNQVRVRDRFLSDRCIFPIWYASGQHVRVIDLVQHLARVAQEFR